MTKKYITQDRMKKKTLADIFAFILEKRETTRREIEYNTGFSWGTVSSNVAYLLEKEYITEEKSERHTGAGRTTYTLKPSRDKYASVGLDVNRSGLSCEVVGLDFEIKKRFDAEFSAVSQSEVISSSVALCELALQWMSENAIIPLSLGIAFQGSIDSKSGISLKFPDISDWKPFNVKELFSSRFSLPVYLGHDPECMLLGEMSREKYSDSILLRIDEGIGMAVSLDGKILDSTDRLELAHTVAIPNGKKCSCGEKGCLEAYVSLHAIAEGADTDPKTLLASPDKFKNALAAAGELLSVALYNVYVLFKPQHIILTGAASKISHLTKKALSVFENKSVNVRVNPLISAPYGAAIESIRRTVKSLDI